MIDEGCRPCERDAIVSPDAWSWSLTQDIFRWTLVLTVKPYIRLAEIEVNLRARACSRNCLAQPCYSLPLALSRLLSGETTSGTLSISRTRSKFCDSPSKGLSSLCSVPPWSFTLFYIKRSCLVSWRTWWSDAPTLPYPSTSDLFGLESVEDVYRRGNRIFLAIVVALKSKDLDGTHLGYQD